MLRNFIAVLSMIFLFAQAQSAAGMTVEVPGSVKQGGVIKVLIQNDIRAAHYVSFGAIAFEAAEINSGKFLTLIPIGINMLPGKKSICAYSFSNPASNTVCRDIIIEKTDLSEAKGTRFVGDLKGALLIRFEKEKAELKRVFGLETKQRYWDEDLKFSAPLKDMVVTSPFGQIRHKLSDRYGKWDTNHFGIDLKASVGASVFAAEDGIVRIARSWLAEGNNVIIDHGYGLLSVYMHLSKLKVKEGDKVKAGDIVGLAGQTGAAQGPHLHFEVRLYGVAVSPWNFMREAPTAEAISGSRGAK